MNTYHVNVNEPIDVFLFIDDVESWFHANDENADLTVFASNLVFAVNSHNTNAFYEIMRDGCINHPFGSRVFNDSFWALSSPDFYFTGDFIRKTIWRDPLLNDMVRSNILIRMRDEYGIDLTDETENRFHETLKKHAVSIAWWSVGFVIYLIIICRIAYLHKRD
ncbi:MAG: hypothetical protein FWG05_03875 [Kiritimatiellaeota bacterium]|nr:hypothetical protein [Kiritimatiellota bacterium]